MRYITAAAFRAALEQSGRQSSRVKDLVGLVLIRSSATFEAGRLRQALQMTFEGRGTHALPAALPTPPVDWGPAYRRLAHEVGLDPDIHEGYRLAAAFLDSLLGGIVPNGALWNRVLGQWTE